MANTLDDEWTQSNFPNRCGQKSSGHFTGRTWQGGRSSTVWLARVCCSSPPFRFFSPCFGFGEWSDLLALTKFSFSSPVGAVDGGARIRFLKNFITCFDAFFECDIAFVVGLDRVFLGIHPPQKGLCLFVSAAVQNAVDTFLKRWTSNRPVRTANDLARPFWSFAGHSTASPLPMPWPGLNRCPHESCTPKQWTVFLMQVWLPCFLLSFSVELTMGGGRFGNCTEVLLASRFVLHKKADIYMYMFILIYCL